MSGVELAACPFCGGEARLWMPEYPLNVDCGDATVSCPNCDADGPSIGLDMDVHTLADWPDLEAEAIAAWNRRAVPMEAWREKVERLMDAEFAKDWRTWTNERARLLLGVGQRLDAFMDVRQALALIPQAEETVK